MYEKDIVIYTKGNTAKIFRRSVKLAKARVWITSSWARGWRSKMYPTGGGVTWSSLVLRDSTLIGFLSTCAQQPSNSISRLISSTNIGLCALKVCLSIFIFIYISEMLCWPPMGDYITQQRWLCLHPLPSPQTLSTAGLCTICITVPFPECLVVGIIQYVVFSDWPLSLNYTHLSFLRVFLCLDRLISFYHWLIFHCVDIQQFV